MPIPLNARERRRHVATALVWTAALGSITILGLIAAAFVFMATSMEPTDLITDGVQGWTDALSACAGFAGMLIVTVLALRLWHTERYHPAALVLTGLDIAVAAWACVTVYSDYF